VLEEDGRIGRRRKKRRGKGERKEGMEGMSAENPRPLEKYPAATRGGGTVSRPRRNLF
jgi:hypothetical protein